MKREDIIATVVIVAYAIIGLAIAIPMAFVANDPAGAAILGIFMPFAVALLLFALALLIGFIVETIA